MQYFLLATFLVIAGESVNLYMRLVVVLGAKIERYVLKVAIVAWGKLHLAGCLFDSLIYVIPLHIYTHIHTVLPIFIVAFTLAPNYRNYTGINL